MENFELTQQQKMFAATGLSPDDFLINRRTGQRGWLYRSGTGYACVKLQEGGAVIWNAEFVKDENRGHRGRD